MDETLLNALLDGGKVLGFKEERERAVERLVRAGYLRTRRVILAMKTVPREEFLPENLKSRAYFDTPLPLGHGQTISALHMVGVMCEYLNLEEGLLVLEVGCGSGYHAAVVAAALCQGTARGKGHVYSVEIIPELVDYARENLRRTGFRDIVTVISGDGSLGYEKEAPYQRILVTAAAPRTPMPLIEQLEEGGILVIPVGRIRFVQRLLRIRKERGKMIEEGLGGVAFVPLRGEQGWSD